MQSCQSYLKSLPLRKKSFEDAVEVGISRACKRLKNVSGARVKSQK